ncbi:phosphotransferase [Mycolicibacterium duvalii]|uniref:Aminoglycoside phosphotransferase domain-containing protein n=1 Tax=Mycolicibacterium duvalii TaxID=39688 RepID=A0A7I7K7P7_9MYCO|nr:phosphotransferase [Mycolicibacterium duvalii]MCV7366073.1 phosphotransferase [Mycolicibacterium duvalii]PEG40091.1 phosphotransferase [Mycolicibacterium duvalii]BBX19521.1 hypothetical protein MDUV_43810 [Mycolicibacterium duvalii]
MIAAALDLLLGPPAPGVLGAAVAEYGGELRSLDPVTVTVRPDGAVLVRYRASVRRTDGSRGREVLVAATGSALPAGAAVVAGEYRGLDLHVGVWRWPQDPALPGLALLDDPVTGLRELGVCPTGPVRAVVRAYRPGRRAVVEISDGTQTWFAKVVRPDAVAALRARHDLLAPSVPVPSVLGCSDDGVVVLPRAPGTPLRDLLTRDEMPLPGPAHLEALLTALPDRVMTLPGRRTVLDRVDDAAAVLRLTACGTPGLLGTLRRLHDELRSAATPLHAVVPTHGDFYEGQLLAVDGRVTGLLDVDTVGPGERADDWATLIGHLSVAGPAVPRARHYMDQMLRFACRRVEPAALRHRVAAVVFGLATGPFRTCHPRWPQLTARRLELARTWLHR